jgi:AraC-like DNA-binding protein
MISGPTSAPSVRVIQARQTDRSTQGSSELVSALTPGYPGEGLVGAIEEPPSTTANNAGDRNRPGSTKPGRRHRRARSGNGRLSIAVLTEWQLRSIEAAIEQRPDHSSLRVLAALVGLTETRFSKAFRATTGLPPHRWIMRRRTERAKTLLADPDLSLTEIAYTCGYSSSSHFSSSFGSETGMTPSGFRVFCAGRSSLQHHL